LTDGAITAESRVRARSSSRKAGEKGLLSARPDRSSCVLLRLTAFHQRAGLGGFELPSPGPMSFIEVAPVSAMIAAIAASGFVLAHLLRAGSAR
jgi:hypothetical protein